MWKSNSRPFPARTPGNTNWPVARARCWEGSSTSSETPGHSSPQASSATRIWTRTSRVVVSSRPICGRRSCWWVSATGSASEFAKPGASFSRLFPVAQQHNIGEGTEDGCDQQRLEQTTGDAEQDRHAEQNEAEGDQGTIHAAKLSLQR